MDKAKILRRLKGVAQELRNREEGARNHNKLYPSMTLREKEYYRGREVAWMEAAEMVELLITEVEQNE